MGAASRPEALPPRDAAALKAELRRTVLARRDALPPDRRAELSRVIFGTVVALDAFRAATTVLAYAAFGSEPATGPFLDAALGDGKTLVLPRISRGAGTLALHRVTDPARQLRTGVWGIREPDPAVCRVVAPRDVDVVLVPGVAFDPRGGRIGYGAGYYDRLLHELPGHARLVAAAFEVQIVDEVPMEPHDRPIECIVTERRVLGRDGH